MRFLLRLPGVRTLHKRHLLFPTVVLVIVAGVLAQGTLTRSEPDPVDAESNARQPPASRPVLRADLEKTPLAYFSDYWHQLAERTQPSFVLIGESGVTGLLVGPGLAVTTVHAAKSVLLARTRRQLRAGDKELEIPETAEAAATAEPAADAEESTQAMPAAVGPAESDAADERPAEDDGLYRLRSWDEQIGLALFDVDRSGESAFTLSDPRSLPSGSYLGAVTLDAVGHPAITPGYLVATRSLAGVGRGSDLIMSMDLPEGSTMAAVVDLDGALVGVAFESPTGLRVVTTTTLLGLIDQLRTESVCRSIEVSDLGAMVKEQLDLERGVLVEYLRTEVFDPPLSLAGADILMTWGGEEVHSREQFEQLYDAQPPGALVSYRAFRAGRRVTGGAVMPVRDCTPPHSDPIPLPRFGVAAHWVAHNQDSGGSEGEWQIMAVAQDGPAALAGVQEGDRLVKINRDRFDDERDRPRLEAAAESDEPLLMSLRRNGRAKLVAVSLQERPVVSGDDGADVESQP